MTVAELTDLSSGEPTPFPPDPEIEAAIADSTLRLAKAGYTPEVSAFELKWWFSVPTEHPQPGLDWIIRVPWLIVHELVEITEWKRKGGRIEGPPPAQAFMAWEEHIAATEIECRLAARAGDLDHVRSRLRDVDAWLADEITPLPATLRSRCERLLEEAKMLADRGPDANGARS